MYCAHASLRCRQSGLARLFVVGLCLVSLGWGALWAQSNAPAAFTFSTLAGYAFGDDADGLAPQARFLKPSGIARDAAGNTYIVDELNYTIRQINPAGVVTTIAGLSGIRDFKDGISSMARFWTPHAIAADPEGNVYVGDNFTVRRISRSGTNWTVTTIAGQINTAGARDSTNGIGGRFSGVFGLAADGAGNVFVADSSIRLIRPVDGHWALSTLANAEGFMIAPGFAGPDLVISNAVYEGSAVAVAIDASGDLFVADQDATLLRFHRSSQGWTNHVIAGISGVVGEADGPGLTATFRGPTGVAVDGLGNVYVADGGRVIRRLNALGNGYTVSTIAGSYAEAGGLEGVGTAARFSGLYGVATDAANNLVVTDTENREVRKVSAAGVVKVWAGSGSTASGGFVEGIGREARFNFPAGVAVDEGGNVYVADSHNNVIRVITPSGITTTLAGKVLSPGFVDGVADQARFGEPEGIAVDRLGNVYVADGHAVRMIAPSAEVKTIAGRASTPGNVDGDGTVALFNAPYDVAVDASGDLYVSDAGNRSIRKLTRSGTAWTASTLIDGVEGLMGLALINGSQLYALTKDGIKRFVRTGSTWTSTLVYYECCGISHLAVDAAGRVFIPTVGSRLIRQITPVAGRWEVTTIGGSNGFLYEGGNTDGAGLDAKFKVPFGIALDKEGNLYISDVVNNNIRKGTFTTYAAPVSLPYIAPPLDAALKVSITPANAGGEWRFPWEPNWRSSGSIRSNLAAGNYTVLLRGRAGYLAVPPSVVVAVTNGGITSISSPCYPTALGTEGGQSGSLTVLIGPGAPPGAGWRFLGGDAAFLRPGLTTNLPPDVYAIEFASIPGRRKPATQSVQVSSGVPTVVSVNYLVATAPPPGVQLPQQVPADQIPDLGNYPFGYDGQLQSDTGYGSGVAVGANVVLTAAHLVFNDQTLSYVDRIFWYPRGNREGGIIPRPLEARGYYVLSGYASQRTNDIQSGLYSPDQSTPQSRNLDVAALFFPEPVAGGGHGGYLPSDAIPSPWLTGTALKMLAGYPVDGSQFGEAGLLPGRLYQTTPQPLPLSLAPESMSRQEVYVAPWFMSYPGNSGGPLYVLFNGYYYPAGVYLGTLFSGTQPYASAVRAIDGQVSQLISLAVDQTQSGTNNTGGGVITIVPSQNISANNKGYVQFQLGPSEAVNAGAAWRLQGDSVYSSSPSYVRQVSSTNVFAVEFKPIPGWNLPTNQTIFVVPAGTAGQISSNSALYSVISPTVMVDPLLGLGITGTPGTRYRLEHRTSLSSGDWQVVSTFTIVSNGFNPVLRTPLSPSTVSSFYRFAWIP